MYIFLHWYKKEEMYHSRLGKQATGVMFYKGQRGTKSQFTFRKILIESLGYCKRKCYIWCVSRAFLNASHVLRNN